MSFSAEEKRLRRQKYVALKLENQKKNLKYLKYEDNIQQMDNLNKYTQLSEPETLKDIILTNQEQNDESDMKYKTILYANINKLTSDEDTTKTVYQQLVNSLTDDNIKTVNEIFPKLQKQLKDEFSNGIRASSFVKFIQASILNYNEKINKPVSLLAPPPPLPALPPTPEPEFFTPLKNKFDNLDDDDDDKPANKYNRGKKKNKTPAFKTPLQESDRVENVDEEFNTNANYAFQMKKATEIDKLENSIKGHTAIIKKYENYSVKSVKRRLAIQEEYDEAKQKMPMLSQRLIEVERIKSYDKFKK